MPVGSSRRFKSPFSPSFQITDTLLWLSEVDSQLVTSKPVGGLPETAKEQLERFMTLYNELEQAEPKVKRLNQIGQVLLER